MKTLLSLVVLFASICSADSRIKVVDQSMAPFPGVLVIVKALDDRREVQRCLTDQNGSTPPIHFGKGLYRVILTCPYGICSTTLREVFGETVVDDFKIVARLKSTSMYELPIDEKKILARVSMPGHEHENIQVLVRNEDASREVWKKTADDGSVWIPLMDDPLIVVLVAEAKLYKYLLSSDCSARRASRSDITCLDAGKAELKIEIHR